MRFLDHSEIGQRLADHLVRLVPSNPAVVVLPPGGVRIGWEIARCLKAPMDVVIVRELCVPGTNSMPVGCVVDGFFIPDVAACKQRGVGRDYLRRLVAAEAWEQAARQRFMRHGKAPLDLGGRTAILVSDGSPSALVLRSAVAALRNREVEEIIYAAPVASPALADLVGDPGRLVSLFHPDEFRSIMLVNAGYRQTTDEEIVEELDRSRDFAVI